VAEAVTLDRPRGMRRRRCEHRHGREQGHGCAGDKPHRNPGPDPATG
jgi:hypothetical protein